MTRAPDFHHGSIFFHKLVFTVFAGAVAFCLSRRRVHGALLSLKSRISFAVAEDLGDHLPVLDRKGGW